MCLWRRSGGAPGLMGEFPERAAGLYRAGEQGAEGNVRAGPAARREAVHIIWTDEEIRRARSNSTCTLDPLSDKNDAAFPAGVGLSAAARMPQ